MRLKLLPLLALLLVCADPAPATGEKALLFVGNSHTYFNDLPGLVDGLAAAAGHAPEVDQSTIGGYTLAEHAGNATTLAKIAEGGWDHVFLQEHSLYPVIAHHREHSFYPAARSLDSLIAVAGSGTSLFMTWGWELGGEHCADGHCCPDYPDYFAMQADVSTAYRTIAEELSAFLVPAGDLWARALKADPKSPLWTADHYHPAPEGSYLAACVFFARIYDESPVGLDFFGGIDPARARFYQEIAAEVLTGAPPAHAGAALRFLPNRPNPFRGRTVLEFELPASSPALLEFFDASGRRIAARPLGTLAQGPHRLAWSPGPLPAGVYFCRLSAGGGNATRRLTLLR
jgi:hypothetical protein